MAKSKKIKEAVELQWPYDLYNATGFDFPFGSTYSWLSASPWGGFGFNTYGFSQQYDQGYGFVKPVYLTTYQLKMIRERSRQLAFFNEYCSAVIKLFQNFVVGDGFKYKVVGVNDDVNQKLIHQTQELVDLYCEHNEIHKMELEYVWRLLVEGEAAVRNFPQSNGIITTRWVENDLILPPSDSNDPDISFGIACKKDDIHNIVGYWIVETPYAGLIPTLVPAYEVNYDKVLTPSNSKRGLPYSFAVDQNFRYAESILGSMISLAISRSKVSMIRKVQNAPPEGIQALVNNTTNVQLTNPGFPGGTNNQLNIESLPNSSVLTSSANIEYEFPDISLGSQDSEVTLLNNLRAICSHYGISETQLTQNIGHGSYASHIVQESPSFKTFSGWQKKLEQYFCGRRTEPNTSLLWKQVQYGVKKGLLPENAITDLKIIGQGPSLLTRDPLQEANTNKIYVDMGVKAPDTVASELGLSYDEQKNKKMTDDSLEHLLKNLTNIKAAGISAEASKKLLKQFHPNIDDSLIDSLFAEADAGRMNDTDDEAPAEKNDREIRPQAPKEPKLPKPKR